MDSVTLPDRTITLGDAATIGCNGSRTDGLVLASPSAKLTVYDSNGAPVSGLNNVTMTVTGTRPARLAYLLQTGAALPITAAGTYRAVYKLTSGTLIRQAQQTITVAPVPH